MYSAVTGSFDHLHLAIFENSSVYIPEIFGVDKISVI